MNQTALITGASSGIGLELAKLSAKSGARLVLTGRDTERLQNVAESCRQSGASEVIVIPEDLADPMAAHRLSYEIQRQQIAVDILINNAGFGTHGAFWKNDAADESALLYVNVVALMQLTRLFLPQMIARRRGKILNVASTAAFQPGPLMANYYASKAYVLSLSEALSNETRRTGVTVTALCPGPTKTEFQKRAGVENSKLFDLAGMSAEAVAQAGFDAMMAGKRVCIPGFKNRLLVAAVRFAPRRFVLRTVRRLNESR